MRLSFINMNSSVVDPDPYPFHSRLPVRFNETDPIPAKNHRKITHYKNLIFFSLNT